MRQTNFVKTVIQILEEVNEERIKSDPALPTLKFFSEVKNFDKKGLDERYYIVEQSKKLLTMKKNSSVKTVDINFAGVFPRIKEVVNEFLTYAEID